MFPRLLLAMLVATLVLGSLASVVDNSTSCYDDPSQPSCVSFQVPEQVLAADLVCSSLTAQAPTRRPPFLFFARASTPEYAYYIAIYLLFTFSLSPLGLIFSYRAYTFPRRFPRATLNFNLAPLAIVSPLLSVHSRCNW